MWAKCGETAALCTENSMYSQAACLDRPPKVCIIRGHVKVSMRRFLSVLRSSDPGPRRGRRFGGRFGIFGYRRTPGRTARKPMGFRPPKRIGRPASEPRKVRRCPSTVRPTDGTGNGTGRQAGKPSRPGAILCPGYASRVDGGAERGAAFRCKGAYGSMRRQECRLAARGGGFPRAPAPDASLFFPLSSIFSFNFGSGSGPSSRSRARPPDRTCRRRSGRDSPRTRGP